MNPAAKITVNEKFPIFALTQDANDLKVSA
jgi:hypothetical protein